MTTNFISTYIDEISRNITNFYDDNYDYYRFGPKEYKNSKLNIKIFFKDILRKRGYVSTDIWSKGVKKSIQLVGPNIDHFEWLYNILADEESKDMLVKVLAFRALGYQMVKLPLNTPAYWDGLKQMRKLSNPNDFIPANFMEWQLNMTDLSPIGIPIRLYTHGGFNTFVLEQYRLRNELIEIAVDSGDIVIDAGACWGDTALYFAHRSGYGGRVYSYEFLPENLEVFRRNLELNKKLSDRIEIIERAVWDESDLRLSIQGEGPASRVNFQNENEATKGPLTLTIDDLVEQQNIPRIDFIKMDIEGAELRSLRGASQTIINHRPKLAISVYHKLNDFFEIPEFLSSLDCGYRFYLRHFTIHSEETVLFAEASRP